jgi:heterodisulfide reductase subunit B
MMAAPYSYYPGCSLRSTAGEFDASFRAVAARLGLELVELSDWSCCGATSAHATSEFLAVALPLRNLVLAEAEGRDLLLPCAACYSSFRQAHFLVTSGDAEGHEANREVAAAMGRPYEGKIKVLHPLEPLSGAASLRAVTAATKNPLAGLKLAPYYGCLLQRPPRAAAFEDPEHPTSMDRVMTAAGAAVTRWSHKVECCGASLTLTRPEHVTELVGQLVAGARHAGADAIVTACPMCLANLDTRQTVGGAGAGGARDAAMPVFYFTELLGLAFGLPGVRSWLGRHITDPIPVLHGYGLL